MEDAAKFLFRASVDQQTAEKLVETLHEHVVDMERGCDVLGLAVALWLDRHTATEEGACYGVMRAQFAAKYAWFAMHPVTEKWRT